MAVFLFLPIAQFDTTDGIYSFTAQGISTVEAAGIPFLMSESTYTGITGMTWDHTGLPNCPNDYR